jgi:hypothetical protein
LNLSGNLFDDNCADSMSDWLKENDIIYDLDLSNNKLFKETLMFKKLWEKIKTWAVKTAWPWIKKSWMQVVNIIVVFVAYDKISDVGTLPGAEALVGLWLFILLAYYLLSLFLQIFYLLFVSNHPLVDQ